MNPLAPTILHLRRAHACMCALALLSIALAAAAATETPVVPGVESQPLIAQVKRLIEAREFTGDPFAAATRKTLDEAMAQVDSERTSAGIQKALDPLCLFTIQINPESRVKAARVPAAARLVEHGWRPFLVKMFSVRATAFS